MDEWDNDPRVDPSGAAHMNKDGCVGDCAKNWWKKCMEVEYGMPISKMKEHGVNAFYQPMDSDHSAKKIIDSIKAIVAAALKDKGCDPTNPMPPTPTTTVAPTTVAPTTTTEATTTAVPTTTTVATTTVAPTTTTVAVIVPPVDPSTTEATATVAPTTTTVAVFVPPVDPSTTEATTTVAPTTTTVATTTAA